MLNFLKRAFTRTAHPHPSGPQAVDPGLESSSTVSGVATPAGDPSASSSRADDGTIQLELREITNKLSPQAKGALLKLPGGGIKVTLFLDKIMSQLRTGKINATWREIRAGTPPGFFPDPFPHDSETVSLSLKSVLSSLGNGKLARRPGQKTITLPSNVAPLFGTDGSLLHPVPASPPVPSAVAPEPVQKAMADPAAELKAQPAPAYAPTVSANTGAAPLIPFSARVLTSAPEREEEIGSADKAPQSGVHSSDILVLDFTLIWERLPEEFRLGLAAIQSGGVQTHLPVAQIEPKLRKGRIAVTWRQLRSWLRPCPGPVLPEKDGQEIELPLPLIAPLFLSRAKSGSRGKRIRIEESIPDLFLGGSVEGNGHSSDEGKERKRMENQEEKKASPPVAAPAASENRGGLSEVPPPFALPAERAATPRPATALVPSAWVEACCQTKGISGAVASTSDGLIIAGKLPPGFSAEKVAGFLPQTVGRLEQFAEVMNSSPESSVIVSIAAARSLLARSGQLYLLVLGEAGVPFPEDQIKVLSSRLIH
jgi:predicted regulator of Ras-like GTPase activity (Roadblock/LC7/MglB family)